MYSSTSHCVEAVTWKKASWAPGSCVWKGWRQMRIAPFTLWRFGRRLTAVESSTIHHDWRRSVTANFDITIDYGHDELNRAVLSASFYTRISLWIVMNRRQSLPNDANRRQTALTVVILRQFLTKRRQSPSIPANRCISGWILVIRAGNNED